MLTHSIQYGLAVSNTLASSSAEILLIVDFFQALLSWTEYFTEVYFYPGEFSTNFHLETIFNILNFSHLRNEKVQSDLDHGLSSMSIRRNLTETCYAHSEKKLSSHRNLVFV
jgi:hypothetical protein